MENLEQERQNDEPSLSPPPGPDEVIEEAAPSVPSSPFPPPGPDEVIEKFPFPPPGPDEVIEKGL